MQDPTTRPIEDLIPTSVVELVGGQCLARMPRGGRSAFFSKTRGRIKGWSRCVRQKRPTVEAKETYCRGKRDLLETYGRGLGTMLICGSTLVSECGGDDLILSA